MSQDVAMNGGGKNRPAPDMGSAAAMGMPMSRAALVLLLGLIAGLIWVPSLLAQPTGSPTGRETGVLPALNFDSDEGFGYGVIAEIYEYGDGDVR
ncbi:MAG: hypothetical protein HKN73_11565, partial [Gemmatimonadetes bacterium]|nr:hypothetical protein [Gemmatimonadota bacterium]